ncbi:cell filamentation protein Fic [Streptomyces sp. NPDC058773]|uniref:cell filamentation protein Fic n=1 Tax=Streptomyces sp. NPDC058773 TaxID=3346632 RepID=UPI0036A4BD51
MISELWPRLLTWEDVDPARFPFDRAAAARVVRSLGPARCVPRRPHGPLGDQMVSTWSWDEGKVWADAMSYALMECYGRWVVGWRWAPDEGDFDGGPVGSWCCPGDSITTPEETLDRVVAALCEWRAWLEELAGRFEAYALDPSGIKGQRILWERAARNLIQQVVDRTGCGSGWYTHCRQVLTWFLSRWGAEPDTAQGLVDEAIGGRFHSWTSPETVLMDDVAERLAQTLPPDGRGRSTARRPTGVRPPATPVDHLARWLDVRETVAWHEARDLGGEGPVRPTRDGAAEDIRAFDGALDPARAEGLLSALELLRTDAARGTPLDFALLQTWQQHVLNAQQLPTLRALPAFAKAGRERYGIVPAIRPRLDACLAESKKSDGAPLPLSARAARAYLDVCFFHPFDNGNARSAFLTLVFVLAREGVTLEDVGLLRRITFQADSPQDALSLTNYIDLHLAETRRGVGFPGR